MRFLLIVATIFSLGAKATPVIPGIAFILAGDSTVDNA
jgi:hypothetical protein